MIFSLLQLEIKSTFRSKQLKTEVLSFVFKLFFICYFALALIGLSFLSIKFVKEYYPGQDVLYTLSGFYIFYWLYDLFLRFMLSSSPVVYIKPLLILNINQSTIVKYTVLKAYVNIFNVIHLCFFIPLAFMLIVNGYSSLSVVLWTLSMLIILSCNSFISIFLDKLNLFFYLFVAMFTLIGLGHLYGYIDVLPIFAPISYFFYQFNFSIVVAIFALLACFYLTYLYYKNQLYLDKGLKKEDAEVRSINIKYLNSLGNIGTFIKNDLYLIIRNKRPRTTVLMSLLFVVYPFLIVDFGKELNAMAVFAAVFATGGFMISFGQFVPSWDSAYYPLFMTQNVSYREYLLSKWYIMAIAGVISFALCSFYFLISPLFFLALIAAMVFNIGFNSSLILLMGAYIRQPIDLTSNSGAFGNTKAFNINTLILSLVIFAVPSLIHLAFQYFFNIYIGFLAVAICGFAGLLLRDKIFNIILKKYKQNKYKALIDFKN
jgi:hypothetical protein